MVSFYMFKTIRKLKAAGVSQAAIAKKLKINPKTVAKYLKLNTPPQYQSRKKSTREDPFVAYESRVKEWLGRTPTLNTVEVFELLLREGYQGSQSTVDRRMRRIRVVPPAERFFEQEYEPAEQSQFDFKEKVHLPFEDDLRLVHLHFGTLPYSNTCRVRGYPLKNYECFMDGVHSFFEEIGGMTRAIRFDNLSPVVKKVLSGSKRLYTRAFEKATQYYGFELLPCAPAKGNEKGDVERDIRTFAVRIKNRVSHENLKFRDWEHLNAWLKSFMLEREKEDTRIKRAQEQKKLLPLPSRNEAILCQIEISTANSLGLVRYDKSNYSVPDSLIGVGCRSIIGPYEVRITPTLLRPGQPKVVIHPRKSDGNHSILLEHVLPSLIRKPHAMVRWAHRAILFPDPICHSFYQRLKKLDRDSAEREYLRSINLVHYVAWSEILAGMQLVLESETDQLFESLRELLLGERRPSSVIDITSRLNQSPLQPELSIYDSFIPKGA